MDKNNGSNSFDARIEVKLLQQSLDSLITATEKLTDKLDRSDQKYTDLKGNLDLFKQDLSFLRKDFETYQEGQEAAQAKQLQQVTDQANRKLVLAGLVITVLGIILSTVVSLLAIHAQK